MSAGVNFVLRKLAGAASSTMIISVEDGQVRIVTKGPKDSDHKFHLDTEVESNDPQDNPMRVSSLIHVFYTTSKTIPVSVCLNVRLSLSPGCKFRMLPWIWTILKKMLTITKACIVTKVCHDLQLQCKVIPLKLWSQCLHMQAICVLAISLKFYVSWSPTVGKPSSGRIVISINWMYKTLLTVCHFENFNRNKFHVFHDLISTIWIDSCFIYKILNTCTFVKRKPNWNIVSWVELLTISPI